MWPPFLGEFQVFLGAPVETWKGCFPDSLGPGREGNHRASASYQFRGAGTGGFPTGLSQALSREASAFQGWSRHHPCKPFEAGQKSCQQTPSLRGPPLALGGAASCLPFTASHEGGTVTTVMQDFHFKPQNVRILLE
jgi:hypothetical protein